MKALLVDDSKAARFAMKKLLEKHEFETAMAESGEQGLEMLAQESFDIVFMDQTMPGMGGLEATKIITSSDETSGIPVVLCTGNEGPKLESMAKEAGAKGILSKPPKAEALLEVIERLATVESEALESGVEEEIEFDAEMTTMELKQAIENTVNELNDNSVKPFITEQLDALKAELGDQKALRKEIKKQVQEQSSSIEKLVNKAISKEASENLVQLEGLRQNVESGLERMEDIERDILAKVDSQLSEAIHSQINSRLGEIKDQVSEIAAAVERVSATNSSLEKGLTIKAAAMALGAFVLAVGIGLVF